ncbi:MAG TPA: TonB-dependent receptor plug domain-containing protein [Opitutaceae bacterium]|nr:TonB-dependent receptor plug domain-containing protein [Opitutaceae bacterium]
MLAPAHAQQVKTAPTPAQLAKYDKNKNGVLDADELATMQADESKAARSADTQGAPDAASGDKNDVVQLTPFEVNGAGDKGYYASSSMSGTRLNSKLEDLGASITVVTKQELTDLASVDINDIFLYESNVEGTGQFTDPTTDSRGNTIDNVAGNPQGANRVRGLNAANIAIGNFASSGTVPIDTYTLDSVEISRGPNASIFGLGDASGTVNLNPSSANITRETTQVAGRIDNFDGWRTSLDVNRPIIRNKLAVRVAGVYEEKGYVRKPSMDRTERWNGQITFKPLKTTTIKLSYETYHNYNQRPNSQPPADGVTYWKSIGSPTWDPVTFTPYINGVPIAPVTYRGGSDTTNLPAGFISPDTGGVRPAYIVDNGQLKLYTIQQMPSGTGNGFTPAAYGSSANSRYIYSASDLQVGGGPKFGEPTYSTLFHNLVIKDKGLYDWSSVNIAAPNYGTASSNMTRLELEHYFLNTRSQLLAFQFGWYREDTNTYSRNIIGQASGVPSVVQVDVNRRLLDGTPNPYFLRPFLTGLEPTISRRPQFYDDYRATLAYQLDLTGEKNIFRWLGRHRFAGYGEYRPSITGSITSHDEGLAADNPALAGLSLTNIPSSNGVHVYPRYYVGDANGQNVDYAPHRVDHANGVIPLYTFDTNPASPTAGKWVNTNVTMGELWTGGSLAKRKIRTEGLTWQSFYLDDRIVPTFGWRKDRNYSENSLTAPSFADGTFNPANLYNFGRQKAWNAGRTKQAGVVVKPFKWLFLSYNQSDSFQPAAIEYNNLGDLLPNPTGKGKDYGFQLNLFNDKLTVRVNKYDTKQLNARGTIGTIDTRARTLDVGTGGGNSFTLISKATSWANTLHGPTTASPWTPDQITTYVDSILGMTPEYVNFLQTANLNDVNDAQSKGYEVEINYNPTRYWTVRLTGSQQSAIDTNLSPAAQAYIDSRLPIWTTVVDPITNVLWWNETTGGTQPQSYYIGNVLSPLKLAVATAGKRKPQTREYQFNLVSNFRFSGITENKLLNPLAVGGAIRWADKSAIGYYGAAPDSDGVIRSLDKERPIFDKALAHLDLNASYNLRLFSGKVRARVQLNIRNFGENTHLQRIGVNPDGNYWNYRIIDPAQYILSTTFDL